MSDLGHCACRLRTAIRLSNRVSALMFLPSGGGLVALLADYKDLERVWNHRRAWATHPVRRSWRQRGCRGRCGWNRSVLGCNEKNLVGLRIQSESFGTSWRWHGLLHAEACGRILLHHRQRAVALGAEGFHRLRIEGCAVAPHADRQIGDDMAVGRRQDDHIVLLAAGSEKNLVFRIEGESG